MSRCTHISRATLTDTGAGLVSTERTTLGGIEWIIRLEALPAFDADPDVRQAEFVSVVLVGVLLVVTALFFSITRERAAQLARTTESLRRSDLLLCEAVRRMQGSIRSSDTLGRRGGDEFVVLLPEIGSEKDAEMVAEKIRTAVERPFVIEGHEVRISSSIGIARYPEDGKDEHELMCRADEAMYRAKLGGRNRACRAC